MAETVESVVFRVQRTFGDEAGVQVNITDVIRWVNDAQKQITIENEGLMETTSTANSVLNQDTYSYPTDLSVLRSIKYKGFRLKFMSFQEFDEYLDGFSAAAATNVYGNGVPEVYTIWNNNIIVFPKPNENVTNGFTIYYIRYPATLTTIADNLDVPDHYFNAIVDYCLAQAYELDEDLEKKAAKNSEFTDAVMKLNERNKRVQEYYPRITTLPEDQNDVVFYGGFR